MTTSIPSFSEFTLLRLQDVKAITGIGRSLIYRLIKKNQFPKQIHPVGSRMSCWLQSEIEEWVEEQARTYRAVPESATRICRTRHRS